MDRKEVVFISRQSIESRNIVDILRMIVYLLFITIYIVFLCMFGDNVTSSFDEINKTIFQCAWNGFPMETQKLLQIILINASNEVYIHGHMNTKCTREVLKKVNGT